MLSSFDHSDKSIRITFGYSFAKKNKFIKNSKMNLCLHVKIFEKIEEKLEKIRKKLKKLGKN
jgi:uncharacterized protein (DUF169 family)